MVKNRNTRQKELLEKKLKETCRLFTAEELYEEVRKEDDKVGIATVYRFLKENSRKHHLHTYDCNRRKIYSSKADNHCHFTCERCGKIEHFSVEEIGFLREKIKGDICHFQIDVSGVCQRCRLKKDPILGRTLRSQDLF